MRVLLLTALLFLPQAESGQFEVSLNGQRIGTEQFSILRSGDGFLATGRMRFQVDGQSVEAESRMELDAALHPVSYEYRSGSRRISVDVGPETAEVEITVDGETTSVDVRFPSDGMIVDDNLFHHYLLLLHRLGAAGGEISVLVPQQLTMGTLRVEPAGDRTYEVVSENLRLRASTDEEGRLVRLVAPDSSVVVER